MKTTALSGPAALDRLETLYNQAVANLRDAVRLFLAPARGLTPRRGPAACSPIRS